MNTTKSLPKAWEAIDTKLNKGSYNGSASDLKTLIDGKVPTINKKSGFNLDKSDAINSANSNILATSTAVKTAYDKGLEGVNAANTKLTRGNLPAELTDSKSLYDLLENNGGLNMDPNLLYLNDAGEKTKGKVYFDKNKKGLFECIETTSSTTNSTTYFVDISNKASSDRLNKLLNIETLYQDNKITIKRIYKKIAMLHIHQNISFKNGTNIGYAYKYYRTDVNLNIDKIGEYIELYQAIPLYLLNSYNHSFCILGKDGIIQNVGNGDWRIDSVQLVFLK